jgi:hypothetical protein
LLPVENPGYIFVRESATIMEESYKSFHQEEGIIVVEAINNFFKEALGFRVSSEYGGGHGTAEEERHSSPRWHEGHTKLVYEVNRTSRTYGGAARPTSSLVTIVRSTSIHSVVFRVGFIIMMEEEEEEKLTLLEKRLIENFHFDDQALQVLGFHTDIYYMLGHLGRVQFSNGVSANTHKEFVLEILMTKAHILDEGVSSFSFRLEGVEQVVPYGYIWELLGF